MHCVEMLNAIMPKMIPFINYLSQEVLAYLISMILVFNLQLNDFLANIHSCSFIGTDDAGKIYEDGSFEILGRVDGSDMRGCSLLAV